MAGRVDDEVVPAPGRLKNTRAASMVMPCACSSLSASSRKAYSNGLRSALADGSHLLELALGQRAGVGQQPADDRALAVIDVAGHDDVDAFGGRQRRCRGRQCGFGWMAWLPASWNRNRPFMFRQLTAGQAWNLAHRTFAWSRLLGPHAGTRHQPSKWRVGFDGMFETEIVEVGRSRERRSHASLRIPGHGVAELFRNGPTTRSQLRTSGAASGVRQRPTGSNRAPLTFPNEVLGTYIAWTGFFTIRSWLRS